MDGKIEGVNLEIIEIESELFVKGAITDPPGNRSHIDVHVGVTEWRNGLDGGTSFSCKDQILMIATFSEGLGRDQLIPLNFISFGIILYVERKH